MSLFDLQDVCIVIGSLATLDLPMVVDLIGIYVLKGPYCTLTTTNLFFQALSVIPRGSWGDSTRCVLGKWVYLVTHAMSLFDLRDVCMVIGSLTTLDSPMVVDLIGIFVLKGPYCMLTMTHWFLQALSVIPRGSWGDVARRFTMIRWIWIAVRHRFAIADLVLAGDVYQWNSGLRCDVVLKEVQICFSVRFISGVLLFTEPYLLRLPTVDSSDGSKSGSAGVLLLRRFVLYRFWRLWVSSKRITKEATLCSLLAFEQIFFPFQVSDLVAWTSIVVIVAQEKGTVVSLFYSFGMSMDIMCAAVLLLLASAVLIVASCCICIHALSY
ncbi:hypothetical protein F511_16018 [Dorcoceras hygrometricum]|uniref:Uncharacterized protein n=1 Tax=Dorcoceras hygrometricum TaxID=472368 RepID=A0A2Z7CNT4_9LAMI|nr:hypothetical protein F511_16018 [Dorcoceras hygrometricum]